MQLRGRLVPLVNAGVAAVLVAVLAAVALVVKPPAPPGIAEFAPRATKPITKAPSGQVGQLGSGPGGVCPGGLCPATPHPTPSLGSIATPPAGRKAVPAAVQCYEWPDGTVTQTFDPQSPPCIASWLEAVRGNGGVTTPGVTATEIRVGIPLGPEGRFPGEKFANYKPLETFFNDHYQFYGRHLRLVKIPIAGHGPEAERADAATAGELNLFAAMDHVRGINQAPSSDVYLDSLAAQKIISVSYGAAQITEQHLAQHAPYQWGYRPPLGTLQRAMGEVACRQLKGTTADHSPTYRGQQRDYVIVTAEQDDGARPTDTSVLRQALSACGIKPPVVTVNGADTAGQTARFVQLRNDGRTTAFLLGNAAGANDSDANIVNQAANAGWRPEWVISGGTSDEAEWYWQGFNDKAGSVFGIGSWSRTPKESETPSARAYASAGSRMGRDNDAASSDFEGVTYHQLALLAAGVQMAGPALTPQSFSRGLQDTSFPNPGAAAAPTYQSTVGFAAASHTMVQDFALVWWSQTARPRNPPPPTDTNRRGGAFCYVLGAQRWRVGSFPNADHFQDTQTSAC